MNMDMDKDKQSSTQEIKSPEIKKCKTLYLALIISTIMMVVPLSATNIFAGAIWLCLVITAYYLRTGSGEYSLLRDHTTYIIRTFWIANLFLVLTSILSAAYLLNQLNNGQIDLAPLEPCVNGGNVADCSLAFNNSNRQIFVNSALIAIVPVIMYLLFRYIRGWRQISKGEMVNNSVKRLQNI